MGHMRGTRNISGEQISAEPAPMEGNGAYNRSSAVQGATSFPAMRMFERAAETVLLPVPPVPIVIADYGAATGRNSLAPMRTAIGALRRRIGVDAAISVIHTDLPENDFTTLFQTLTGDPESYLNGDEAVFASAVGSSFYRQILPSCSVALGWSSWAVQWLSRVPAQIPDHIQVAYSDDAAAQLAFARQAEADWRVFLLSRGWELCLGGRLVIVTMACRDDGEFGYRGVLRAMYAALQELVIDGLLHAKEVLRMAIPTIGRSRAEFVAPFSEHGSFGGLRIEHIELFDGEDRIWSQFERDGDAGLFGASWAAFSRASVFPTLALSLDGGRGDPRAPMFLDRLEAAMAAQLARKPEPMVIPLILLVLAKEPS
jgi:hypothetical protein